MAEILFLIFLATTGVVVISAYIYLSGRTGEDCPGYPYNCPCCPKAARCIIEIGRKDK